jgi:hypothetical protein
MERHWEVVDDRPGLRARSRALDEAWRMPVGAEAVRVNLVSSRQASCQASHLSDVSVRGPITQADLSAAAIEVFLGA